MRTTVLLSYGSHYYTDTIKFSNAIMFDKERNKDEQHLRYILEQWKKIVSFGIMNNISGNITLVQLIDSLFNVDHEVSVFVKWIFILTTKLLYH